MKRLDELNVNVGDKFIWECRPDEVFTVVEIITEGYYSGQYRAHGDTYGLGIFDDELFTRAPPTIWSDMSPEEKGALLLAKHEGKVIEVFDNGWFKTSFVTFADSNAYRVKPDTKGDVVVMQGYGDKKNESFWFGVASCDKDTHRITFNTIDGVPDCGSVKMERIA